MTASKQLPAATDELTPAFALFSPFNAANWTAAATSTVAGALLTSCRLPCCFATTYIPAGAPFAARFSVLSATTTPPTFRIRPSVTVSVRPPARIWDSTLSFNFEIGLCLVTAWAWAIPVPSGPRRLGPGRGGGQKYSESALTSDKQQTFPM